MEDDHRVWPAEGDEEPPWNPRLRRTASRDFDRPPESNPTQDQNHPFDQDWNRDRDRLPDRDRDRPFDQDWDRPSDQDWDRPSDQDWDRPSDRDRVRPSGRGRGREREWDWSSDRGHLPSQEPFDVRDRRPSGEESLPPSARFHGSPTAPTRQYRPPSGRRRRWRRRMGALLALALAGGLVAGLAAVLLRMPAPATTTDAVLSDPAAQLTLHLPPGWREVAVPPVTGFTSAARNDGGALLMIRRAEGTDVRRAADDYASLLLQGDSMAVVADTPNNRAMRAEYDDVVNRPAYLRVTLVTRGSTRILLAGLLQPDEPAARSALDTLMNTVK